MNQEDTIQKRLERLEHQIAPVADSARSISELREELVQPGRPGISA